MGNWGDDWDPEVINRQEPKGRFTVNFKKITTDIDNIVDATMDTGGRQVRLELLKEWAGAMTACFVLFLCSYKVFVCVTFPFFIFYFIAILRIGGAWKHFKLNTVLFWLMTIISWIALFALAYTIQTLLTA